MQTVLVSGAGSGLGKALALRYASDGADVCVTDINEESGQQVARLINDAGGSAFYITCDITNQSEVDNLFGQLTKRWRSLDMLINNAGVATAGSVVHETMDEWQTVLNVNLLGHVRMTKAFIPLIQASSNQHKGIINIASQSGLITVPFTGSYSVSNAAMVSFSETLYLELSHDNIHVSVVCPSFFNTNIGQSLHSQQPGLDDTVSKLIARSGVTAAAIADKVFHQVKDKKFMIITHRKGRSMYLLKRYLPVNRYLKIMLRRSKRYVKSV